MTEIHKIDQAEAEAIIDTRKPLGLFYVEESTCFVGIDNTRGSALTEEFGDLETCVRWLRWEEADDD
jgi:hypothetical protein